jgi:hypothetical protein
MGNPASLYSAAKEFCETLKLDLFPCMTIRPVESSLPLAEADSEPECSTRLVDLQEKVLVIRLAYLLDE